MINRIVLLIVIQLLILHGASAKLFYPNFIQYQSYSAGPTTQIYSMIPLQNDGFLLVGRNLTKELVIKIDQSGTKQWDYVPFDESYTPLTTAAVVTKSGKYILAGKKKTYPAKGSSYGVIRLTALNSFGFDVWEKTYDNSIQEIPACISEMNDGGLLVAGILNKTNEIQTDITFIKTDSSGNLQWRKQYGVDGISEAVCAMEKTDDGGIMVLAHKANENRSWLLRLNSSGDTLWTKVLYYKSGNKLFSIKKTDNGNFICAGVSQSFASKADFWVIKIDDQGNAIWSKDYNKSESDTAKSIDTIRDGGYCFAGNSGSSCVLMRLSPSGDSLWSIDYSNSAPMKPASLVITSSGKYAIGGTCGNNTNLDCGFFLLFENEINSIKYPKPANWELIDTSNSSLVNNCVSKVVVDSTNRIWLVVRDPTYSKVYVMYQDGEDWKTFDAIPSQQIMEMTVAQSGDLWFAGDNGIYHYDGKKVTNTPVDIQAFSVAPINSSEAYVGSTYGLNRLTNGHILSLPDITDTMPVKIVDKIVIDSKSVVWYSIGSGVAVSDDDSTLFYDYRNSPIIGSVRDMKSVSNNIWISTTIGLIKNTNGQWTVFDSTNTKLPSSGITAFSIDSDNNPIIACNQGFVNVKENKFYEYNNSPLPSNIINDIAIDRSGNILIGTSQGLVIIRNIPNRTVNNGLNKNPISGKASKSAIFLKSGDNVSVLCNNYNIFTYYNLIGRMMKKNGNSHFLTKKSSNLLIARQTK